MENERLSDQFFEGRRQNEVLKAQIESLKSESEREIQDLRDKHKQEL